MPSSRVSEAKELSRLWKAVSGRLQIDMSAAAYKTWIEGARPLHRGAGVLTVEARSSFVAEYLRSNLLLMADGAASAVSGDDLRVEFVAPGGATTILPPSAGAPCEPPELVGRLNRRFTFDRYLPTMGNRAALEACVQMVDEPQGAVQTLTVYGVPGMGKTHLLHALAAYAYQRGSSCACLTAEEFTNRFQHALRGEPAAAEAFHERMRSLNLLIIDDLQSVAGKTKTVDEIVHTMDAVKHADGFTVIASETNPLNLNLPDRLLTRLAEGVVTALDPFDRDERRLFVERTARDARAGLPTWCIDRLAASTMPSVRFIIGMVNSAIGLHRRGMLTEATLDAELMRFAIAQSVSELSEEEVIERVVRYFEASFTEIQGRSRQGRVAQARAVLTVAFQQRGESFAAIGRRFDNRDRATVRDLFARGQRLIAERPELGVVAGIA